jgi:hypothetical protein
MGILGTLAEGWEKYQGAKRSRSELKEAFAGIGMNFMQLHPLLHRAILREAIATDTSSAIAAFAENVGRAQESVRAIRRTVDDAEVRIPFLALGIAVDHTAAKRTATDCEISVAV